MITFNITVKIGFTVVRKLQYQGVDKDDAIIKAKLDEQYKALTSLQGTIWSAEPI